MKYVIGVIYLIEDNIDIDLTCQVLQDAIGYSNHKINTGELYCPYWQVCEKLVSEGIMRRTKDPLVYVLRKEGMKKLIIIDKKKLGKLHSVYTRETKIEGEDL